MIIEIIEKNPLWMGDEPRAAIRTASTEDFSVGNKAFLKAADRIITKWDGTRPVGLYLYGEPGTGKTTAAAKLVLDLMNRDPEETSVYWAGSELNYKVLSITRLLTTPLTRYLQEGKPVPEAASSCMFMPKSIVVLDDYGNPVMGEASDNQKALSKVVHTASEAGALVIVTSNQTDPFAILDTPEAPREEKIQVASFDQASKVLNAGIETGLGNPFDTTDQREKITESIRSRFGSMFLHIRFEDREGTNLREQNSFWYEGGL